MTNAIDNAVFQRQRRR